VWVKLDILKILEKIMEIEKIKDEILHTYLGIYDQKELELYKKFYDNFNCGFRKGREINPNYVNVLDERDILIFDVNLNHYAKNIEDVVKQLENSNIKIGKLTENWDEIKKTEQGNLKIEYRGHENGNIKCEWEDGKNYGYTFEPYHPDVSSRIHLSNYFKDSNKKK